MNVSSAMKGVKLVVMMKLFLYRLYIINHLIADESIFFKNIIYFNKKNYLLLTDSIQIITFNGSMTHTIPV